MNTDELIDSNEKLLSTPKILLIRDFELRYFSTSPKNSLLFKFVTRKKENYQYATKESNGTKIWEIIKKGESSSFFIFSTKPTVLLYLLSLAKWTKNPIIFMKPTSYHKFINVYYLRKNSEKNKKKIINQW